jgi:hypothetical protein
LSLVLNVRVNVLAFVPRFLNFFFLALWFLWCSNNAAVQTEKLWHFSWSWRILKSEIL